MSESVILAEVLIAVTALPDAMFTRQNTGTARTDTGRVVRFGRPGQPDIQGCYRGTAVGIEVKTPSGRQSAQQRTWQSAWERAGGRYILARSADEALSALAAIP